MCEITEQAKYNIPDPILNQRELDKIAQLNDRYKKMTLPNKVQQVFGNVGNGLVKIVPQQVKDGANFIKDKAGDAANRVVEQQLVAKTLEVITKSFGIVQQEVSKYTIKKDWIIGEVNKVSGKNNIHSLEEFCLIRSYDLSKVNASQKNQHLALAAVEGGAFGAMNFVGIPLSIAVSTLLYYRAVQAIALQYGYDAVDDPDEMVIANEIFKSSMSPQDSTGTSSLSTTLAKVLALSEVQVVKDLSKKTWVQFADNAVGLLILQMRALANAAAKKALEKAGKQGLEKSLFRSTFTQIGKHLTKKSVGKMVPFVGAALGAAFDTAQMVTICDYADVFYQRRFLLEKGARIRGLSDSEQGK